MNMNFKEKHLTIGLFVLSALVPMLFTIYMLLLNGRYFFIDDKVSDMFPKLYDMGMLLRNGEFPILTTNIMNGSAYALEYQYAVFNPVNLILSYILPSFKSFAVAGWFISAIHLSLSGLGAFMLARNVGLRGMQALTLSLLFALNYHGLHWNASAWYGPLIGSTWVIFGIAFLAGIVYLDKPIRNTIGLFVAYSLCITSGWPLAVIAVAITSIFVLFHLTFLKKDYYLSTLIIIAGISSVMVSSAALISFFSAVEVATRPSAFENIANFLVAPLDGLITFFDPSYSAFMNNWGGGYSLQQNPQFYVGWFLLPLLLMINWSKEKIINTGVWVWGGLMLVFLLTCMGPERLGVLRFPIRSIPYFHFFLILFLMVSAKECGLSVTKQRVQLFLFVLVLQCIHSLQSNPSQAILLFFSTFIILAFSIIFFYMVHKERNYSPFLWFSSLFIFAVILYAVPHGRGVDWGIPSDSNTVNSLGRENYTLFYGHYVDSNAIPNPHLEYRVATTALLGNDRSINGYTPIGHKGFREILKISNHGNFEELCADTLFEIDSKTQLSHAELMRVDRIIALKGSWAIDIEQHITDKFALKKTAAHTLTFDYINEYSYPGLVSWISPSTIIEEEMACKFKQTQECLNVTNTPAEGGEIIFARLWFPGYSAYLDGKKLDVTTHKSLWVTVKLPPLAKGQVRLEYTLPKANLIIYLMLFGTLLFITSLFILNRRNRQAGYLNTN
ncbi:MAG: hypothetical protein VSS52_004840 [Thiotrichaceae bacterium]|nr:hypothetical protein [Thiotrichaceae bacterium]